jgi:hypothetical protein
MKFTFATQKIEDAVKKAAQVAKPYARVAGVVVGEALVATAVITYKATSAVFDAAYQIGKEDYDPFKQGIEPLGCDPDELEF